MAYLFYDLDLDTRNKMDDEFRNDIENGNEYISPRINPQYRGRYLNLFHKVIVEGYNEVDFSNFLKNGPYINAYEYRAGKQVKVPSNAAKIMAEGEFNRYYMRALCLRATEEKRNLIIYRARESSSPDKRSEEIIGKRVNADLLLGILRNIQSYRGRGAEIEHNLGNPNSGLSIKFA